MRDSREIDESFMREALAEARTAAEAGEVPIGAVVVHEGEIIARAHNRRELDDDPSAHAEFSALVAAARVLGRWRLTGCTVYVTLEPCAMCAGLMVNARVDRCVYGAADPKAGALGSLFRLHDDERLNHRFAVESGILGEDCAGALTAFFRDRRRGRPLEAAGDAMHEERRAAASSEVVGSAGADARLGAAAAGRELRMLVAVDSFKGSATSAQAAAWIAEGVRRAAPGAEVRCLPVADGGEGLLDAMQSALGGELVEAQVPGPLGDPVAARRLRSGDVAVIEAAEAAGFGQTDGSDAQARSASSRGVGELVRAAVADGARTVHVGLGGTCTSDGGAGFLQALGARILDEEGGPVPAGIAGLERVASVDLAPAMALLAGVELVALADVRNPLVGRVGALAVFGGQKGLADPFSHDRDMVRYAQLLDEARGRVPAADAGRFRSVAGVPGAGAAGGLGAAILSLGGRLESGAEAVLSAAGFDEAAQSVDVVVTGEGRLDGQTASGKVAAAVARRARALGKPVIAVVGGRSEDAEAVYRAGVGLVITAVREPMGLERALEPEETRANLRCAGESAARAYLLRP
ncbi:MAG: glycerate kinase [Coriobacteriaceae bacterium]|nr:glycerate kinase [Coriobacteriaceae bacterium]